ncbi:LppX_LprAFG lipoprotein [Streptomyces mutabilis]|uniref:LppX_LprAFG lipoprotein n=1 Tax=Streptomyces mutabilis TaxID=67332 RepID=UPI000693D435|nr:LppX_LprAFG lipoprotein [Streptomyces mutabilis]
MHRTLLLAAAGVMVCSGCSTTESAAGDDAGPSAASPSADHGSAVRAAVTAVGKETARIDQEVELTDGTDEYVLTVAGGFDFAGDRGRITVELPGGAISRTDEIFADGRIYVSGVGGLDEGTWGSVPRDTAEAHYVLRAPLNDPEHVLRQISAMRQVRREGEETVDGVRATHYRGTLDHDTLTLRMADDTRKKTDDARDLLGADLPVFADAWVDDRGRLVRARMDLNMSGAGSTVTMDLSDFGTPVRVTAPEAEATVGATDVTGILMG